MKMVTALFISIFLISCDSNGPSPKDLKADKSIVAVGEEDSGGGGLFTEQTLEDTQKKLTEHIKNFINLPKYTSLVTRYYYKENVGLNKGEATPKAREVFQSIVEEGHWGGDGSHPLFGIKEVPALFRSNADIFISKTVQFSKKGCFDKQGNGRIAAVSGFNLNSKICLDLKAFSGLPTISFEPVLFSLMFHEICHLQGHKDEGLCFGVQGIAEQVVSQKLNFYWISTVLSSVRAVNEDALFITQKINADTGGVEGSAFNDEEVRSLLEAILVKVNFIYGRIINPEEGVEKISISQRKLIDQIREDYSQTFVLPYKNLLAEKNLSSKDIERFYLNNEPNMIQFIARNFSIIRSLEEL